MTTPEESCRLLSVYMCSPVALWSYLLYHTAVVFVLLILRQVFPLLCISWFKFIFLNITLWSLLYVVYCFFNLKSEFEEIILWTCPPNSLQSFWNQPSLMHKCVIFLSTPSLKSFTKILTWAWPKIHLHFAMSFYCACNHRLNSPLRISFLAFVCLLMITALRWYFFGVFMRKFTTKALLYFRLITNLDYPFHQASGTVEVGR